jgi:3-hydroxyisobutyrate dehydrogenase
MVATRENTRIGWVGTGRMGFPMALRLLRAGWDVAVWNRTRSKAEPLRELGAQMVDSPAQLADRDVVFTMVSDSAVYRTVTLGADGILSRQGVAPAVLVDTSTVSAEATAEVRAGATPVGTAVLAAPVSGNPAVVAAGSLSIAVSGPEEAFRSVGELLRVLGSGVVYVGEGDRARMVKICHNLLLGVVSQTLAEIIVLAEQEGIARRDLLGFLNQSVVGSVFSRYKTPALVTLDYTPTFTVELLLKDFDLGVEAGRELGVPLPVAAHVRGLIEQMVSDGYRDLDFAAMLDAQAKRSGVTLSADPGPVSDGLLVDAPAQ